MILRFKNEPVFLCHLDISAICLTVVLELAIAVFISLCFQTL